MDCTPIISVIMAVYNGEKYLQESVESVLNQTFPDLEFIIVDDGSTDRTWPILAKYDDPRIRLIQNVKNIGLASSLNKALSIAVGSYVARMDADDISLPDRLAIQHRYLEANPEVGVLGTQMIIIDMYGRGSKTYHVPSTHGAILWGLFFGNPLAHPTVMFRRDPVVACGGYDETIKASQDKDLWIRLCDRIRFANLEDRLVKYRRHPAATWARHARLAHEVSFRAGWKFAERMLGKEIPEEDWRILDLSQNSQEILVGNEVKRAGMLILDLYEALESRNTLDGPEKNEIRMNLIQRIAALNKRISRVSGDGSMTGLFGNTLVKIGSILRLSISSPREAAKRIKNKIGIMGNPRSGERSASTTAGVRPGIESNIKGGRTEGISILILSYERMGALTRLLRGLLDQDLGGIETEIIIVNNSSRFRFGLSRFSKVGTLLRKFPDVKVLNSTYNWGPGIRYAVATASRYKTILFFDDDIYPVHRSFVASMYRTFKTLRDIDILTCWADLWLDWSDDCLTSVSMGFLTPEIADLIECDYCGTGISMLDKDILMCPEMLNIPPEYKFADTAWFPWIPFMVHGTRKYYFPSFGLLEFHKEKRRGALCGQEGYESFILASRKKMIRRGYRPVADRLKEEGRWEGSSEQAAAHCLEVVRRPW